MSHIVSPTDFYVNVVSKANAEIFSKQRAAMFDYYERIDNSMLRAFVASYDPKVGQWTNRGSPPNENRSYLSTFQKLKTYKNLKQYNAYKTLNIIPSRGLRC